MNGIILGAGRGSRLMPLTADRPKCLVDIDGIPLIDRQVRALQQAGVSNLHVVAGWHGEALAARGFDTLWNTRWAHTTMVHSLQQAAALLYDDVTIVSYGDIIYSGATVRCLVEAPYDLAISYDPDWIGLWTLRFDDPLSDAETFQLTAQGTVSDIGGRPTSLEQVEGQYMGLLRFTPTGWEEVERILQKERGISLDMTGLLQQIVKAGRIQVHAIPVVGPWCEIDHPHDLELAVSIARVLDAM